jgi:hypothetical protein
MFLKDRFTSPEMFFMRMFSLSLSFILMLTLDSELRFSPS